MKKIIHFNKITFIILIICVLLGTGITAVAINNQSQQQDNSENEITVHYYNENQWENPYVYCYFNNSEKYSWPGKPMSNDGNDWYSYTINGFDEVRVIFSDNGNNQNPRQNQDGYLIQDEMWYCSGNWYAHEPENTIVHYYNSDNWSNVKLYYYQGSLNSPKSPGVLMHHEKGYWYNYEMVGFDNPKVILAITAVIKFRDKIKKDFLLVMKCGIKMDNGITKIPMLKRMPHRLKFIIITITTGIM